MELDTGRDMLHRLAMVGEELVQKRLPQRPVKGLGLQGNNQAGDGLRLVAFQLESDMPDREEKAVKGPGKTSFFSTVRNNRRSAHCCRQIAV